ncbi:MAG: hypothetical protein ACR2J6_01805 [Thermoleophilaceae bacterium]
MKRTKVPIPMRRPLITTLSAVALAQEVNTAQNKLAKASGAPAGKR